MPKAKFGSFVVEANPDLSLDFDNPLSGLVLEIKPGSIKEQKALQEAIAIAKNGLRDTVVRTIGLNGVAQYVFAEHIYYWN